MQELNSVCWGWSARLPTAWEPAITHRVRSNEFNFEADWHERYLPDRRSSLGERLHLHTGGKELYGFTPNCQNRNE